MAAEKVSSGDRLVIPAAAYNSFVDAAAYVAGLATSSQMRRDDGRPNSTIVLGVNETYTDLGTGGIAALDAPAFLPSTSLAEFKRRPVFRAVPPYHPARLFRWAVAIEPIASGKVGRFCVEGLCVAKVAFAISGVTPTFADLYETSSGDTTRLQGNDFGAARILWRESGDGDKWALLRLGDCRRVRRFELTSSFMYNTAQVRRANARALLYDDQAQPSPLVTFDLYCDAVAAPFGHPAESSQPGSRGLAEWNPHHQRWELTWINTGMHWGKVQSGQLNFDPGGPGAAPNPRWYCYVKLCWRDGTHETGSALKIILPEKTNKDPALFTGDVIGFTVQETSLGAIAATDPVCITDCHDDKRLTIKMWSGTVANIPKGWKLCDGANGTIDLSGRFAMCIDEDGRADEKTMGGTGGYRWHGYTENNHPDHDEHVHQINSTRVTINQGAGAAVNNVLQEAAPSYTGGVHDVPPGIKTQAELLRHKGSAGDASPPWDTDNRPRFYVLAFIQRVE